MNFLVDISLVTYLHADSSFISYFRDNWFLGHFDRLFTSAVNQDVNQTFYNGLMAEALINYYQLTQDPRIPPTIKKLLDWEWANGWNS